MTVTTTVSKDTYNLTGATTNFTFNFKILAETNLVVIRKDTSDVETTLTLTTDYTVNTGPWPTGGTITTVTNYADGTLIVKRDVSETQNTDYTNGGKFPADSHEDALDKGVMMVQELVEKVSRALLLPEATLLSDLNLPNPAANNLLGWNSTANGVENKQIVDLSTTVISAFMSTLLTRSTAALARTDLVVPGLADNNSLTGLNDFSKILRIAKGASLDNTDVDGSNVLTIGQDGFLYDYSGTDQVDKVTTVGLGAFFAIRHTAAAQWTHDNDFIIGPNKQTFTSVAGDISLWYEYAAGKVLCYGFLPGDGRLLVAPTAAQGSSKVLLESPSGSSVSSVTISAGIWSLYSYIEVFIKQLVPVSASKLLVTLNGDVGASDYEYAVREYNAAGTLSGGFSTGDSSISVNVNNNGNDANRGLSGSLILADPGGSHFHRVNIRCDGSNATPDVMTLHGSGTRLSTAAVTSLELKMSTGNISSYDIRVYGIKDS